MLGMTPRETFPATTREPGNTAGGPAREDVPGPVQRPPPHSRLRKLLRAVWSQPDFGGADLTCVAKPVMRIGAHQGVFVLSTLTMLMMTGLAPLYYALHLGAAYVYTLAMLAALAVHTSIPAQMVSEMSVPRYCCKSALYVRQRTEAPFVAGDNGDMFGLLSGRSCSR